MTPTANRSLFSVTAIKPTQDTKCGVIISSDPVGLPRVRSLQPNSLLHAAGVREGDFILDIDGIPAVGAVEVGKTLRNAFGEFELLIKRPFAGSAGFGSTTTDEPSAWTLEIFKTHADEPLSAHVVVQSVRMVNWVGGRASSLNLKVGDRVLAVDGESVNHEHSAEHLWLQATAGKAIVLVVEAGEAHGLLAVGAAGRRKPLAPAAAPAGPPWATRPRRDESASWLGLGAGL